MPFSPTLPLTTTPAPDGSDLVPEVGTTATRRTGSRPVVVGVDGSDAADLALDWAVDEARRRGRPLHVVHAREVGLTAASPYVVPADEVEWVLPAAHDRVAARAAGLALTQEQATGLASNALVDASQNASAIVVGTRRHSMVGAALLGSTSLSVATRAGCPVIVVREPAVTGADRVVVGVDGSATSDAAVGWAFEWAGEQGLPLTVVHAWPGDLPVDVTRLITSVAREVRAAAVHAQVLALGKGLAPWREAYPDVAVHIAVPILEPVDAIVTETIGARLVVVGSRGRGGLRGLLLGSVSEGVLHQAHCPVAVVRSTPAGG